MAMQLYPTSTSVCVKGSEQRVPRPLFFRAGRLNGLQNPPGNAEDEKNPLPRERIEQRYFGPPLCAYYLRLRRWDSVWFPLSDTLSVRYYRTHTNN